MIVHKAVVHPQLCDIMGHLTTRHYMAMFDDSSYHCLYTLFGWSGGHSVEKNIGWADVKHEIEYLAEASSGDLLEIKADLEKIGNKSITIRYSMYNLTREELSATLLSTSVLFDTVNRSAIRIPEEMRAKAQPFLNEK